MTGIPNGTTMGPTFFIGDVALDEYYVAERWPGLGDKVMVEPREAFGGGMIANAACVHAALGGATEFISLLNTGPVSQRLCSDLEKDGVGVMHMLHDDRLPDSKTIIVLVGDEHAVLIPELGEMPMVLPDDTFRRLCTNGLLYTTLGRIRRLRNGSRDAAEVLGALHAAGRRVILDLDVDGFAESDLPFLRHAHVVIMNQQGFQRSFDNQGADGIHAWLALHDISMLVVTRGAAGVIAYTSGDSIVIDGLDLPVVDVTGAGDTFGGALTYAIQRTTDIRTALAFASSAASRSVTQMGPRAGMVPVCEVLRFMEEHGVAGTAVARKLFGDA